ncbi:hypothetical protein I7I50_03580 [Histoplasma capsulatum G186AR]|uniref:Uncharacterized protein n=1 Tax=Ajellomyces capsulatus TaxID=5037 RepID=A0A8H7YL47_AJECA|nr:hypothetical protein I7I52_04487 [Histoplasma capsulatum]QSS74691.1 hypothetical protein I7I50_03580 [Histoplasma capsulatum G186AR]
MNCGFNVSSTLLASTIFCFFYPYGFNTNIQHCFSLLVLLVGIINVGREKRKDTLNHVQLSSLRS